ncbi:MAG: ABC transporter permease, partial [Deltaproteobacteria bacterium]
MKFKRFWIMFVARNREFFRDRAAFGWNFLFPFLIVAGFGVIFSGRAYTIYKVGIFPYPSEMVATESLNLPESFITSRHLKFIGFKSAPEGLTKLK